MRANPSSRSFTLGGSGGMVVGSGCLDGPTGHPADSAWIEASVERRVKPTGAGTHQLTARRVPGGARPGRWTGVPCRTRRTGANTPWQLEGQHLTGGRSATVRGSEGRTISVQRVDSQAILSVRRGPSEGGLPGSARRAKQGAAAALVDSRTRRIVPGGECLCGEPPHFTRACQLDGAAFALRISLKWPHATSKRSRTAVLVDERVRDKRVCRRRRGKECERLSGSTVSL